MDPATSNPWVSWASPRRHHKRAFDAFQAASLYRDVFARPDLQTRLAPNPAQPQSGSPAGAPCGRATPLAAPPLACDAACSPNPPPTPEAAVCLTSPSCSPRAAAGCERCTGRPVGPPQRPEAAEAADGAQRAGRKAMAARSLFGPSPSRDELDQFFESAQEQSRKRFRAKWGFDVETDLPVGHPRWQWRSDLRLPAASSCAPGAGPKAVRC